MLDKELVELAVEVLVGIRVIVRIAQVVVEPLDDVIHLEPFAPLKKLDVFLMNVGRLSPVLPVRKHLQGLTDDLTQVRGFEAALVTQLDQVFLQRLWRVFTDSDFCLVNL